jgi:hypothetical protein
MVLVCKSVCALVYLRILYSVESNRILKSILSHVYLHNTKCRSHVLMNSFNIGISAQVQKFVVTIVCSNCKCKWLYWVRSTIMHLSAQKRRIGSKLTSLFDKQEARRSYDLNIQRAFLVISEQTDPNQSMILS